MIKNIIIVAVVAVLVLWAAVAGYRYLKPADGTYPGATAEPGARAAPNLPMNGGKSGGTGRPVHALGRLEPEGGLIDVGGMAGDRLGQLKIEEGDLVELHAELGYLDSHALRLAEKQAAEAQLAEAQMRQTAEEAYGNAQLEESQLALEQLEVEKLDVEAQRAKGPLLETNLALAKKDLQRFQGLDSSIISKQELEHQEMRVQQADAELKSAAKQLAKMEAGIELNDRLAKAKQRTAEAAVQRIKAASMLASLEKNVELADSRLQMTVIRAPVAGQILKILTRPGENIGPKPILRMGNTKQMAVVAEVYETDILQVAKNQRVLCKSPALSQPLTGKVKRIGTTVAKNEVNSLDPTASADARVVEVHIELDPNPEAARLINLQVDVEIDKTSATATIQ
jgi:HlyD family secretion protein